VYPVSGQVLLNGQPLAGALVALHPVGEMDVALPSVRPNGRTGPDGTFVLTTYETHDGAPPGEYAVIVECHPAAGPAPGRPGAQGYGTGKPDAEPKYEAPDRLGGRYRDPRHSGLRVRLAPEPTVLPPFHLK
jgi:hypothetical protein